MCNTALSRLFELRNLISASYQRFNPFEDPELFVESEVKTNTKESSRLYLQDINTVLEHTSQS